MDILDLNILDLLAATAEVCGTSLSLPAAQLLVEDLCEYPQEKVRKALQRCRREVKGRLSLAEIVSRIDDGRPGADEAWSMVPKDEDQTGVMTAEMTQALQAANPLLLEGDKIAARMAFRETYKALVDAARAANKPVEWSISLGWDKAGRESVLREAIQAGRITAREASAVCLEIADETTERLAIGTKEKHNPMPEDVRSLISGIGKPFPAARQKDRKGKPVSDLQS